MLRVEAGFVRRSVRLTVPVFLVLMLVGVVLGGCAEDPTPPETAPPVAPPTAPAEPGDAVSPPGAQTGLTGDAVIPPVDTEASGFFAIAVRSGALVPDAAANEEEDLVLTYLLQVEGLEGITGAYIYQGFPEETGPVVYTLLEGAGDGGSNGTLADGTMSAAELQGPLQGQSLQDFMQLLSGGELYVQVHTQAHPQGEIRGQLIFAQAGDIVPEPPPLPPQPTVPPGADDETDTTP